MSKLLLSCLLAFNFTAFGFVSNLNTLLKAERNRFFEKNNFLNYSPALKADIKNSSSLSLDQDFLISTLLRISPLHKKFISTQSQCSLYSYLLSGLSSTALGQSKSIAINYQSDNKILSSIISLKDFYDVVVKSQCPKVLPLSSINTAIKFQEILKQITELTPKNSNSCEEEFKAILFHPQIFNLCSIYQQIKKNNRRLSPIKFNQRFISKTRKSLSQQDRFLLENLCMTQKNEELFCKDIFEANYWQKISQGKASPHVASLFCASAKDMKSCLSKISSDPKRCQFPSNPQVGLLPAANCESLSLAHNNSSINTQYPECPLQLENMGVVNSTRLLAHLQNKQYSQSSNDCVSFPLSLFADFNLTIGNPTAWDYKLCYWDKIAQIKKCFPSIIGALGDSKYSQEKIITKILKKNLVISGGEQCQLLKEKEYRPHLLKYKSGCYILSNFGKCSLSNCKFKIIYNEKIIDIVKVENYKHFDYISHKRDNRDFSQVNLITQQLKKKSREIRNLSVLNSFFNDHPKAIIHGVGCAESLLPSFFKTQSFNQCQPLPFIIDGVFTKDKQRLLVMRTALDHLHTPRLTTWNRIFSAVKLLHDIHPQKKWSLYGIH